MKLQDRFVVFGSPENVADFMLDIDRVSDCVPEISDVRQIGADEYEASLVVRLGPIKAAFKGSVQVDAAAAPQTLAAVAQGRDKASGSVAKVLIQAHLEELPGDQTSVDVHTDVSIRGKLGQYGTAVIRSTATAVTNEFARCLDARLRAASGGSKVTSTSSRGRTARLAFASIGVYIRGRWTAFRARFRGGDRKGSR